MKSTVEQIRERFDAEVERFSNLDTGQIATIDAPLVLELITQTAAVVTPGARELLDIGCGAGNYTLKMLQQLPGLNCTLVDLSKPMLDRALQRIGPATSGSVATMQGDMREVDFGPEKFDLILAAATLHHLRTDAEWEAMFRKLFAALRPGGSVWISDLVEHTSAAIQRRMWERYGEYLVNVKGGGAEGTQGEKYKDGVFAYVEREDTPRPLLYQLDLLRRVGFSGVDVLHKNSVFAAFGAWRES